MLETQRRAFLLGSLSLGTALFTSPARATLLRGLSLSALVARSQRIVVGEPLEAVCVYAEIGGRTSIVTDTRVRVHERWGDGSEGELTVRTLGGRLDGVGELVHGQAQLDFGQRGVAFLKLARDGQRWWTTGMAQGHFPLSDASETSRLLANRGLPTLLNLETSAVRRLVGERVGRARELVSRARPK